MTNIIRNETTAGSDAIHIVAGSASGDISPMTATIESLTGGYLGSRGQPWVLSPISFRLNKLVTGLGPGGRIDLDNLSMFGQLRGGAYDGATVRLNKNVGGVWSDVIIGTVTTAAVEPIYEIVGKDKIITALTHDHSMATFERPGYTRYYFVRAVDLSAGIFSPWSAPQTFTTPATPTNPSVVNSTSSFTESLALGALAAPENFSITPVSSGQVARSTWDAVSGADGYQIAYADVDNARNDSYLIVSGDHTPISVGDQVWITNNLTGSEAKEDLVFSRVWNASATGKIFESKVSMPVFSDPENLSIQYLSEGGAPFVRYTNNSAIAREITRAIHGPANQSFYPVLLPGVTYRSDIYARSSASTTVQIRATSVDTGGADANHDLTSSWATYTHDFSRNTTYASGAVGSVILTIPAGGVIDVGYNPANFNSWSIYDSRYPPGSLPPAIKKSFGLLSEIRDHRTIKTRPGSYDLDRLLDPQMLPAYLQAVISHGNSVAWLQIEPHLSATEWLGLVEYLAAPYDPLNPDHVANRPLAKLRRDQGRSAPWTDSVAFRLEIGNEMWQDETLAEFYQALEVSGRSRGEGYALLVDWVISVIEGSPYFSAAHWGGYTDDDRLIGVYLGGWGHNTAWNAQVAATTTRALWILRAMYMYGWDNGAGLPDYTFDSLQGIVGIVRNQDITGRAETFATLAATYGLRHGTYESGQGYALPGLGGQGAMSDADYVQQLQIMGSAGAGSAAMALFLVDDQSGADVHNYFALTDLNGSRTFSSHMSPDRGGAAMPAVQWVIDFWQQHLVGGDLYKGAKRRSDLIDVPSVDNVDPFLTWKVKHADRFYIIVFNQDILAGRSIAILDADITASHTCARHFLNCSVAIAAERVTEATQYQAHNTTLEAKDDVVLSEEAHSFTLPFTVTLPPGMLEIYEFTLPA